MKDSDEAVERVLAGLSKAEAPEGMERRILEAVGEALRDKHPGERASWRRSVPWRLAGTVSWATAAAGVAVVAGMLCWSSLRSSWSGDHARDQSVMLKERMGVASTSTPEPERGSAEAFEETTITPIRRSQGAMRSARILRVRARDVTVRSRVLSASYPAPPMPLTEQERLLLRVAHGGDPELLAMLNPVMRAMRDAEEKEKVENFFEPATIEGDHE